MPPTRSKGPSESASKTRTLEILERLDRAHPDAKLALNFSNPLELLVALILAAQARDDLVNQVTARLFTKYRKAKEYANAPLSELEEEIRKINFYRNKAKAIQRCCQEIVHRFGGEVPREIDDLLTLPGVGRKTANILIGNAFGRPAIGVDTHVMRLSQRLGLTRHTDTAGASAPQESRAVPSAWSMSCVPILKRPECDRRFRLGG
jgi:endonuclease-3